AAAGRPDALPFLKSAAPDRAVSPPSPNRPIPGSPWANEAIERPPRSSHKYEQTLDILEVEEVEGDGQAAQDAPNVPAPAPAPVPAAPLRPAMPDLKGDLYKKFSKKK